MSESLFHTMRARSLPAVIVPKFVQRSEFLPISGPSTSDSCGEDDHRVSDPDSPWNRLCAADGADMIELRFDSLWQEGGSGPVTTPDEINSFFHRHIYPQIIPNCKTPLLATLRTQSQGGSFSGNATEYAHVIDWFTGQDAVRYVDIESTAEGASKLIERIHQARKWAVASFHDFEATPSIEDMITELSRQRDLGADIVKIAVMPHDIGDVLTLCQTTLSWSKDNSTPLIAIAMGRLGMLTRAFGHRFGSSGTFASVEGEASAPGQMDIGLVRQILNGS